MGRASFFIPHGDNMHPDNVQIGHRIKANNQALAPASNAAGTRNGGPINVSAFQSAVLVANIGAASGTPTTLSVTYAVQTSANGTSGWTALKDVDGADVTLAATAAGAAYEKDINLTYAPADSAFIRVVETVAFTGGTAPAVVSGAVLVLGGAQKLPV